MRKSHEILLRLYHDPGYSFGDVEICYINRGAPGNVTCVPSSRILSFEPYYIEIASEHGTSAIPYHRLVRILYRGQTAWDRSDPGARLPVSGERPDRTQ